MIIKFRIVLCAAMVILVGSDYSDAVQGQPAVSAEPIRKYAEAAGKRIGVAVDPWLITNTSVADSAVYKKIIMRHFNYVVAENVMKFGVICASQSESDPLKGAYYFGAADALVAFAAGNKMKIRGHTLVWHNQQPMWVTSSFSGDELRAIMENHIDAMLTRYKGKIDSWDVVNEAINDNPSPSLRATVWRKIGDDYINRAFVRARAVDPTAKLFYNDYSVEEINAKSNFMYMMVKRMLSDGVPIDGVGLQCHFISDNPPDWGSVAANIKRFTDLGIEVHLTEIDFRIEEPVTEEKLIRQARNYKQIIEIALGNPKVTVITFWGITDLHSWIPYFFSGYGAALPLDESYRTKPAFEAILETLKSGGKRSPGPAR
jgi:endo-1,4-beta-xylanase